MKLILVLVLFGFILDCAYAPTPAKDNTVRNNAIKWYFNRGYAYKDITLFLAAMHGIRIGVDRLKAILKKLGLKRRTRHTEESLKDVVTAIQHELDGSGKNIYYEMHKLKWRSVWVNCTCK